MIQNKFVLNQNEYFFFKCGNIPIEEVTMPYSLSMIWSSNNKKTMIGRAFSFNITENLIELLSAALENKLFFDEQIYLNIGLIWNLFDNPQQAKPVLLQYASEQNLKGELENQNYVPHLWCAAHHSTTKHKKTFIYNNEFGEIVLLVTPHFFWKDDPDDSNYLDTSKSELTAYFNFLKNYKPIFKRIIPVEIAKQWISQATYLHNLFTENEFGNCTHCNSNTEIDFEKHPNGLYHERSVLD